jgi:hypothetical protein
MIKATSLSALALAMMLGAGAGALAQSSGNSSGSSDPALQSLPDATKQVPPKPIEGQIVMQDMTTLLASNLMGATVYSPKDEVVGDVNDLIMTPQGQIQGMVVGVGGFLGMGEKDVALKMDRFSITPSDDGSASKLVLNATVEDLTAAPAFKSAYAQKIEKEDQARQMGQTTQDQNALGVPQSQPEPPKQ